MAACCVVRISLKPWLRLSRNVNGAVDLTTSTLSSPSVSLNTCSQSQALVRQLSLFHECYCSHCGFKLIECAIFNIDCNPPLNIEMVTVISCPVVR